MSKAHAKLRAASVALLGVPYVACDEPREFVPERRFQLLAYLAHAGEWLTRDALAFIFWPDQDNAGARRNLRWLLHSVRNLPEFGALEIERDRVRLTLPTDVRRFEASVREGKWPESIVIYRGPFCKGLEAHGSEPFVQWLTLERGRLSELFRAAAMKFMETAGADDVVPLARRLLDEDASDEDALAACLRALRALDRGREAKRLYRDFSERLMVELGLEPGAETRALAHELETPTGVVMPPPAAESSFVGRAHELAQIAALLAEPECRLLTLIGPGGVGKSRLAKQAVANLLAETAWFIPLEGLAVPAQVPSQVARVIGLRLAPGQDVATQIQAHLGQRRYVLVLDNFEHLIDAADLLARWLDACPKLRVVVTSRERLGLTGEWLLVVEGLAIPSMQDSDFEQFDAVRLFVERARGAKRGFDPTEEQSGIAQIVSRVEGMPLAIELAAAWVRLLPCADIARDLASGLELLETTAASRPIHQSVRASFEHSWALLMARERGLFTSLSVFRGGFGREAARHVAGGSLPAIAQLVDKSLVRVDAAGRFSMHPLLHQFAAERLSADSAEETAARRRHAEYFAHWMERFGELKQLDQKSALSELETELDNCLAAWQWALDQQRADLIRSGSVPLLKYFECKSFLREGLACFDAADKLDQSAPGYGGAIGSVERAKATLSLRLGHYANAEEHARSALHHSRLAHDSAGIKSSLTTLGLSQWQRGRYGKARPYFLEGLKRTRADGDRAGEGGFLSNLALLAKADGNYVEAESLMKQAIEIHRETGDADAHITALNNLGNLSRALKDPARGRAPLLEALALVEHTGNRACLPFVLLNLALVEMQLGELDSAYAYCEQAVPVIRDGAERQIEIGCYATMAKLEILRCAPLRARTHLRAAALLAREYKHLPHRLGIAVPIASALRLEGNPDAAAAIVYMVRAHPSASQPDRDDVDLELALLRGTLPVEALDAARARSAQLVLDDVIAEAIRYQPPR